MSYIGQQLPADVFSGFTTDSFTGDGSATTFTLSKAPFSEDGLIVVINNVIQQPTTNFTVSGTTLTIVGTAVANGDPLYAIHTSGAVPSTLASKVDVNGVSDAIILDADADTTISADTDDQIDFKAGGTDIFQLTATTATFNDGVTITTADNTDTLTLISTDADGSGGPILDIYRNSASPADDDTIGKIVYRGRNDNSQDVDYGMIEANIVDASDGTEDGNIIFRCMNGGALNQMLKITGPETVFNDASIDTDFRVESNSYGQALLVDGGENAVFVGTTAFYDTDAIFTVRSGASSSYTQHLSNTSSSFSSTMMYFSSNMEEDTSSFFQKLVDTNDTQISFRLDGNGFFDGAADAGNADFAEYFESTDGSAIAIGKTVVLDSGKVRASTDSDNAADIVGVVRHRKTVGVIGNSAWSKWKGKYKVDDYGVPLLEEYTVTEWDEIVAEDADDLEVTYKGEKKKLKQIKGDTIHHSYHTDQIPSELTAPSDAVVKTKDADGNTYKRKILSDSYDASKEYVSREDRDEWNLIGLTGQVTMTKGQKTGDRWIKMRDISDTVEEWLIR